MAPAPRMTVDEYLETPETVTPTELIYGVLRVADAPTPRHQLLLMDLAVALWTHVRAYNLGKVILSPIDVILDRRRDLVVQPDLIFISRERLPIVTDRVWGASDMVLEVLSPHPRIGRLSERIEWFAAYGVRECWLLHQPERRLDILGFEAGRVANERAFADDAPIQSVVLPEFSQTLHSIVEW